MSARHFVAITGLLATLLPASGLEKYTPAERRHWAFQKRTQPPVPVVRDPWVRGPVDAFILERLRKDALAPSPEASRSTLIRRLYFDMTGLPPTPAEVAAFVKDTRAGAWERAVDKVLASPHYGERMAQHWLDVVRFAETDGFEYDTHRRDAWRYRDYVIRSFNSGKPYDQFLREQLAGDEMSRSNEEYRIAAGFQRLGPLRKNAGNQEVASSRNEVLTEMTNVVGSALLGVTLGCARCHDHKFDPIRHTDYYRMQSFFASTHEDDLPLASQQEQAEWKARHDAVQDEMKRLKSQMKGLQGDALAAMEKRIKDAEARVPEPLPALFSVANDPAKASPMHVLARGEYQNKGEKVGMRPLGVLLPDGTPEWSPDKPRTALAQWVTDPENPLTARVAVNRMWQMAFGRGIVATPNDFGRMGARPTHPELLDYLANRLVSGGWQWRTVQREILLSSAYRQSSRATASAMEKDPENRLVGRYSRKRLDAEQLRDAMLTVSGALNTKTGGPSVIVPVDKELIDLLYKPSQWAVTPDPSEHNRRSVYLIAKRNLRLPFMEVFDAPDLQISCARRESSTHAPQALELMNGTLTNRLAESFAERLKAEPTNARRVDLAYRLTTGQAPSLKERTMALAFLKDQPLREFALAMFNLNKFLYVE